METFCGTDCTRCPGRAACKGCAETDGHPFGSECVAALYARQGKEALETFKARLIAAFNALPIPDMEPVTHLNALKGSYINLEYTLPNGQRMKFWDDNKIYFGNQQHKKDSDRCYGVAADDTYLLVSEYGCDGADAEIVACLRWNKT